MGYQVVINDGKTETVGKEGTYFEAYAEYEKAAKKINARDKEGNYLNPDTRISIRQA